jgi:hypothetical protein
MFRKNKLLILIPALLLIPLLTGMIPIRLANKLAHGGTCTQSQDKHGCGLKNCSPQSFISQNHFDGVTGHSTPLGQGLLYFQKALPVGAESVYSHISFTSIPLRC